jgi:hypothetical protein
VTLTFRTAAFRTLTRRGTRPAPTAAIELYRAVRRLLQDLAGKERGARSPSSAASELSPWQRRQLPLFDAAQRLRVEQAEDAVRARFGPRAIRRVALREPGQSYHTAWALAKEEKRL